jgi:pilus assembly protein Flp/PilA
VLAGDMAKGPPRSERRPNDPNVRFSASQQGTEMSKIVEFIKNESGATAIEYGLIAAGISVAIIAAVNSLGTTLNTNFTSISTQLK